MSTESMIRDVELAEEPLPKKAGGPPGSRRCFCLSLFSFLLVAGATTLFCLLHFGVIGPQREEVSAPRRTWLILPPGRVVVLVGTIERGKCGERWGGRRRYGERWKRESEEHMEDAHGLLLE